MEVHVSDCRVSQYRAGAGDPAKHAPGRVSDADAAPALDIIELLFFSYRDFVGDADRRLAADGFGRAHHRVLYFVSRNPGMTVAGLLELLRITKQSLNRVLKELLDKNYVTQREGEADRRQRLLYVTDAGAALAHELAVLQSQRINRALAQCAPAAREHVVRFLDALVDWPDTGAARVAIGRDR